MRPSLRRGTDRPPPPPVGRLAPVPRFGLARRVSPGVAVGTLVMGAVLAHADGALPPPDAAPQVVGNVFDEYAPGGSKEVHGSEMRALVPDRRPRPPTSPSDVTLPPGDPRAWMWDDGY